MKGERQGGQFLDFHIPPTTWSPQDKPQNYSQLLHTTLKCKSPTHKWKAGSQFSTQHKGENERNKKAVEKSE